MTSSDAESGAVGERLLTLAGTVNARDVGGYATPDGPIAWNQLVRTDALNELDDASRRLLADLGLRTVVDLRRDNERIERPSVLDGLGVEVRHISISSGSAPTEREQIPTLAEVYAAMIEVSGPAIASAISVLAEPDALPAIVHCSAGKDRTGVVIAFTLESLGVDDDVIAEDYAVSASLVRGRTTLIEKSLTPDTDDETRAAMLALLESPSSLISDVFTTVREQHGSVTDYLVHHGMDPSVPDRLRSALIR